MSSASQSVERGYEEKKSDRGEKDQADIKI